MAKTINVKVQPKASVKKVVEIETSVYKVYTTKPAVDGQANVAVIEMMAEYLKIKKNKLQIKQGHTSRNKVIEIYE